MIRTRFAIVTALVALLIAIPEPAYAEDPIATIAVISNPYITTLPPNQIKDERGSVRDFLATTAAPSQSFHVVVASEFGNSGQSLGDFSYKLEATVRGGLLLLARFVNDHLAVHH